MARPVPEFIDYYEVLGVSRTATTVEIKSAYRRLAHAYHPDVNSAPNAEEMFKRITAAYEVLKDQRRRTVYDIDAPPPRKAQKAPEPPPPPPRPPTRANPRPPPSPEDKTPVGAPKSSEDWTQNRPRKPLDIDLKIEISYTDAIAGTVRRVSYKRRELCKECGGRRLQGVPCKACGDGATTTVERWHAFQIPRGAVTGHTIEVPGAGDQDTQGTGDLRATVILLKQPGLDRKGHDFFTQKKVPRYQLERGAEVTVHGPSGPLTAVIPEGTAPGAVLRIEDAGLPYPGGTGSLFVMLTAYAR